MIQLEATILLTAEHTKALENVFRCPLWSPAQAQSCNTGWTKRTVLYRVKTKVK